MGKAGGKQVTTSGIDQSSVDYNNRVRGAAGSAANGYATVGPDGHTIDAANLYSGYAKAGLNGVNALNGDAGAVKGFLDPYLTQVVDASNRQFTQDSAQLDNNADSAATQTGAFGGSRAAVVKGAAQSGLALGHQNQVAGLLSDGYNTAMARAGQVANLGLSGASGAADIGSYLRDIAQKQANPDAERLRLLQEGQTGPNSTTSSVQAPNTNWLQTAGSIAGIGSSLFYPSGKK